MSMTVFRVAGGAAHLMCAMSSVVGQLISKYNQAFKNLQAIFARIFPPCLASSILPLPHQRDHLQGKLGQARPNPFPPPSASPLGALWQAGGRKKPVRGGESLPVIDNIVR